MKIFDKLMKKSNKGQVLVIMAIIVTALVAVIGLSIDTGYTYVTYSRVARAVDAAALAATGEFKRSNPNLAANMAGAAIQILDFNGVTPDASAGFADPTTGRPGVKVETCITNPLDKDLCPKEGETPKKLVRVTVQERVPIFFLAVVPGMPDTVPIVVSTISQAASLDVVLLIDSSESMAWYNEDDERLPQGAPMSDPKVCNESDPNGGNDGYKGDCFPFQKVKIAASAFVDRLYFPYDRVSVISFNQKATVNLPLSSTANDIKDAINDLQVYEGMGRCAYDYGDPTNPINFDNRAAQLVVPPPPYASASQIKKSCRLLNYGGGSFYAFDCPLTFGPTPSTGVCGNTNPGEGLLMAGNALAGKYPSGLCDPNCPIVRDDAVWVVIYLSDGSANSAFDTDGTPICPGYTQTWAWLDTYIAGCRDNNANNDALGRHDKNDPKYDPDDYARDMADFVGSNNVYIFSIGMPGIEKTYDSWIGPPPGRELMEYAADENVNPTHVRPSPQYYPAASSSELNKIFLAIANKIATRINQ